RLSCLSVSLCFVLPRPPPTSTLFPYTTLFRSGLHRLVAVLEALLLARRFGAHEPANPRQLVLDAGLEPSTNVIETIAPRVLDVSRHALPQAPRSDREVDRVEQHQQRHALTERHEALGELVRGEPARRVPADVVRPVRLNLAYVLEKLGGHVLDAPMRLELAVHTPVLQPIKRLIPPERPGQVARVHRV